MLGQTVHLRPELAAPGPFVRHMGSHNYSPGTGEVGESASLGQSKHVAELDGGAGANALGVERMTTVALPVALRATEFVPSIGSVLDFREMVCSLEGHIQDVEGYGSFPTAYAARQGVAESCLGLPSLTATLLTNHD